MRTAPKSNMPERAASGPQKSRLRPDFATICGFGIALAGIIGGLLLEKGSIADLAQFTAAWIVLGGTMGAMLVTTPLSVVRRAFGRLKDVFFEPQNDADLLIQSLAGFAAKARRSGIVSLESDAAQVTDR